MMLGMSEQALDADTEAALNAQFESLTRFEARPDMFVYDDVVFTLKADGSGYEYDDPRGEEVVAKLAELARKLEQP
jgi:hypothetical protein